MLKVLDTFEEDSIDCIITDPPYELNFMNKGWDNTGIVFNVETWKKCLRVLKPGGYLLCFGATRIFHRVFCAIEDAGFEIRDTIMWLYGAGFPKSMNVGKQLEKRLEDEKTKQKTEHDLRLMWERDLQKTKRNEKKQDEVLQSQLQEQSLQGTMYGEKSKESNLWRGEPCLERWNNIQKTEGELQRCKVCEMSKRVSINGEERWICNGTQTCDGKTLREMFEQSGSCTSYRPQPEQQQDRKLNAIQEQCRTQESREVIEYWNKFGTALKPAYEPIMVARKPFDGSLVDNVLANGVGGINIDECRVGTDVIAGGTMPDFRDIGQKSKDAIGIDKLSFGQVENAKRKPLDDHIGRFPSNVILSYDDNSKEEVCGGMPYTKSTGGSGEASIKSGLNGQVYQGGWSHDKVGSNFGGLGDEGSAARYFKNCEYTDDDIKDIDVVSNLQPNYEPILMARKPFETSLVDNVLENGVGGLNIDECRIPLEDGYEFKQTTRHPRTNNVFTDDSCGFKAETNTIASANPNGRFPANVILTYDDTDEEEVCGGFPFSNNPNGSIKNSNLKNSLGNNGIFHKYSENRLLWQSYEDSGSASRYFKNCDFSNNDLEDVRRYYYCPKASKKDRNEGILGKRNMHPTVKPSLLLRYLIRLVAPKNAIILDPFNGSGSTGKACMLENRERDTNYKYIGIDLSEEYLNISKARIEWALDDDISIILNNGDQPDDAADAATSVIKKNKLW